MKALDRVAGRTLGAPSGLCCPSLTSLEYNPDMLQRTITPDPAPSASAIWSSIDRSGNTQSMHGEPAPPGKERPAARLALCRRPQPGRVNATPGFPPQPPSR